MNKTERKLRKAFENATPNVLNTVLSECCEEKGTVIPMTEKKKVRFKFKEFAATAAAIALLFGVGYFAAGLIGAAPSLQGFGVVTDTMPSEQTSIGEVINDATSGTGEPISWQDARDIALSHAEVDIRYIIELEIETELNIRENEQAYLYEVSFNNMQYDYTYWIDGYSGKVLAIDTEEDPAAFISLSSVSPAFMLLEIALEDAGLSKEELTYLNSEMESDTDLASIFCELTFIANDNTYQYRINARSGEIVYPADTQGAEPVDTAPVSNVTFNSAIDLAVKYFGLARSNIMYEICELDKDKDFPHYDISFYCDGYEYECEVGIDDGQIRDAEKEPLDIISVSGSGQASENVTYSKAIELAAKHFDLSTTELKDIECELDDDDGKLLHYDVSFRCGGYEYECEVDIYDGTVRNAEKEIDN